MWLSNGTIQLCVNPQVGVIHIQDNCNTSAVLALNIRDCVSLVGRGSSMVGAPLRNLGKFVSPTLPVSFGGDTKSRWSLLSGVYARGSKNPTQGG